jgi:hypothetical protein
MRVQKFGSIKDEADLDLLELLLSWMVRGERLQDRGDVGIDLIHIALVRKLTAPAQTSEDTKSFG